MESFFKQRAAVIGISIIFALLQVIVAPYIRIGYGMCNFILVYVVVKAIIQAEEPGYVVPFLLGLLYDLSSTSAVGAMAFICVLLTFLISLAYRVLYSDSLGIFIALAVVACFVGEFLYAVLMIACGADVSFLDALIYRVLPCGVYDSVIAVILLPLARFFGNRTTQKAEMTILR